MSFRKYISKQRIASALSISRFMIVLFLLPIVQIKAQSTTITTENITFKSEGDILSSTLYTPEDARAAVVIVHGSGREARMSRFALQLAESGISVLTYDKRGVGESSGVYVGPEVETNNIDSANLALLAKDANAALNVLHSRNNNLPVGLVGFSQAGWIIPIAASTNPNVGFMVLFSGPVISTLEQLRFQFYTDGNRDFWDTHTQAEARNHIFNDADRYQFADTNPVTSLSVLSIPGLWLFGSQYIQVPVELSMERLNDLKLQSKSYDYYLFPGLGHNVAFDRTPVPIELAIRWIKNRK